MAVWYAQNGGDFIQSVNWTANADGSGGSLGSNFTPTTDDTFDLNGQSGISLNDYNLQGDITIQDTPGTSGGLTLGGVASLGAWQTGMTINVELTITGGQLESSTQSAPIGINGTINAQSPASSYSPLIMGPDSTTIGDGVITVYAPVDASQMGASPQLSAFVFESTSGGLGCLIVSPTSSVSIWGGPFIYVQLPAPSEVTNGTTFGIVGMGEFAVQFGTYVVPTVPAASDVRHGVAVGDTTGTCYVPAASQVLTGVNIDATTGNVVLPSASFVLSGVNFGAADATAGALNIAAAVWNSAIAGYDADSNSFGWLFATKLLPIAGQVAAQSDVAALQNNTSISLSLPPAIQIPASGSIDYPITIYLRDSAGAMTNATETPTVTVVDTSGTSYASRLSAIANPETGKYTFTATIQSTDTEMLLVWEVTAALGEGTQIIGGQSWVTQQVMAYFTTDDRSTLQSLAAQVGSAGAGLTALPPVALTEATHTAIAADVQTGLADQGFTSTRAGYLDTLTGLAAAVWSVATSSLGSGVGQRLLEFMGLGNYSAPSTPQEIAAAVLRNSANPLATDALGRVTPAPVFLGTGSVAWPLTIGLAGSEPLGNAQVWVTSDEAGATIVAGPATTDSQGRVIFSLDPGAYYRWALAAGCTFSNPQTFTVSVS